MPIITGMPKPHECRPVMNAPPEPADIFCITSRDYRFTGYKLPTEDGMIVMNWPNVSEPAFWGYRATSIMRGGTYCC
jgi:hypothetical protein